MKLKSRWKSFVLAGLSGLTAIAIGVVGRAGAAGIPGERPLRYSGTLHDANGAPLEGQYNLLIQLSDSAAVDVAPLCEARETELSIEAGRFGIDLPDACTEVVASRADLWIEVSVDGQAFGKVKVSAVPFAVEARHAVRADVAETLAEDRPIPAGRVFFSAVRSATGFPEGSPCRVLGDPALAAVVDCTCPQGTFVVSGGADAGENSGSHIRESRPVSDVAWRLTCANGTVDAPCVTHNLVCSRVGPSPVTAESTAAE